MMIQEESHPAAASGGTGLRTLSRAAIIDAAPPTLVLQVGYDLDPGIVHKQRPNEDTLSVTRGTICSIPPKPFALLMVADGMGGHMRGQEASRLAVHTAARYIADAPGSERVGAESFPSLLKAGILHANQVLYQRNQQQQTNMGTTMTAVLIVDSTAYVAHVGDSRCYLYRQPAGLAQITQDHSLVAALAAAGVIKPEEIYTHPRRNLIYRSLGEKASVEVDTCEVALATGDILLLCSDGLWEMARDPQIAAILTAPACDPTQTACALVRAALAGGGEDNVSALVAWVSNV